MSRFIIFADNEQTPEATVRQFRTVQKEGDRQVECYNLAMVRRVTLTKQLPPPPEAKP